MTFAFFANLGMTEIIVFLIVLGSWGAFCFAGAYVSKTKNRPAVEGALFGLFPGPIGLLIAAVLPTKEGGGK